MLPPFSCCSTLLLETAYWEWSLYWESVDMCKNISLWSKWSLCHSFLGRVILRATSVPPYPPAPRTLFQDYLSLLHQAAVNAVQYSWHSACKAKCYLWKYIASSVHFSVVIPGTTISEGHSHFNLPFFTAGIAIFDLALILFFLSMWFCYFNGF